MNSSIFFLLLLNTLYCRVQDLSEQIVFSSIPIKSLEFNDIIDLQQQSSQTTIQQIQATNNFVYVKIEKSLLKIYDLNNLQNQFYLDLGKVIVCNYFVVSLDDSKIFCSSSNQIFRFDFKYGDDYRVQTQNKIQVTQNLLTNKINQIVIDLKFQFVLAQGGTQICIYQYEDLSNFKMIDIGEDVSYIKISLDGKLIFCKSKDQNGLSSIRIFEINQQTNDFTEIGGIYKQFIVDYFDITYDNSYIYCFNQINQQLISIDIQNIQTIYYSNNNNNKVIIQKYNILNLPLMNTNMIITSLKLLSDQYLVLGVKYQGLYFIDISDQSQVELFYQIYQAEIPQYTDFNGLKRNYLITSDFSSIKIFQSQNVKTNDQIPNLFNTHLLKLFPMQKAQTCLSLNNNKNILINQNNQIMLSSFYNQNDPLVIKSTFQKDIISKNAIIDINSSSLYMQSSQISNYLDYYKIDFDDLNLNLNQKLTLLSAVPNLKDTKLPYGNMVRSQDGTLIAVAYGNGFLLFDSSKFSSLNLIKQINFLSDEVENLEITSNNQWIICTQINLGLYAFVNIQDKNNISLRNVYRTNGVSGVITFQNGDYAYLYCGSKGLIILDTLQLPQISIVGTLQTNEWMNYINIFPNEKFLTISQSNQEMILLVDIQDKTNPQIVSKIQISNDIGYSSCLSDDKNFLYLLSQQGLRTIPIQSKIYYQQTQYIFDDITGSYSQIRSQQNLKVGFSYSINLTPLYPPIFDLQITNIFFYQNFSFQSLPDWIKFSFLEKIIYIQASKECEKTSNLNYNFVLLQVQSKIERDSFIFTQETDGLSINKELSNQIFSQLKNRYYITPQNFANPLFFQQLDQISLSVSGLSNDQMTILTDLTLRKLLQSIQIVPIQFHIEPSLQLDLNSPQKLINTPTRNITCTFQLSDKKYGVFVNKSYDGVVTFLTQDSTVLILKGLTSRINQILSEKSILFYNFTQIDQISFNLTIQDFINYDFQQAFSFSELQIITIQKAIQLKFRLQDQLVKMYPDGILYINSQIVIQFNNQTFETQDKSNIQYIILVNLPNSDQVQKQYLDFQNQIIVDYLDKQFSNGYQLIPQDFWMKADSIQLRFTGFSSYELFYNRYKFKIIAFDGYSLAEDQFQIELSRISFSFIILIILYALGPLIILVVLFKFRKSFQNLYILKKWGRIYQDQVYANTYYIKKIVFVGDELRKAQNLLDAIIHFVLNNEYEFKKFCKQNILEGELKVTPKIKYKTQLQNELEIKFSNENAAKQRKQISKNYLSKITPKNFGFEKENLLQDLNQVFKYSINPSKQKHKSQHQFSQINSFIEQNNQKINNKNNRLRKLINLFIDQNTKDLSIDRISYFLKHFEIQFEFEGKIYGPEYYEQQIIDQGSVFYYCLMSCVSQYLLSLDYLSYQTIIHLKQLVKLYQRQKQNQVQLTNYQNKNWYSKYAYIQDQKNVTSQQLLTKPYSEVYFDIDLLQNDLKIIFDDLQEITSNKKIVQILNDFIQENVNFGIIKQFLISKKLGLIKNKKILQYPFQESSIHLKSSEIDAIECFKLDPSVQFSNLRYYFSKASHQLLLSKGINLMPNWIKLEIKSQNCLIIHGTPTFYEIGQIQIRIYDKSQIIVSQFSLQILLKGQRKICSAKNIGSQNQQNGLAFINKFSSVILSSKSIINQQQQQEQKLSPGYAKNDQDQNEEPQNTSFKSLAKRKSSMGRSSFVSIKLNKINEIDDQQDDDRKSFKDRQDTQELDLADECAIHLNFSQHKKFKRKETIQN